MNLDTKLFPQPGMPSNKIPLGIVTLDFSALSISIKISNVFLNHLFRLSSPPITSSILLVSKLIFTNSNKFDFLISYFFS